MNVDMQVNALDPSSMKDPEGKFVNWSVIDIQTGQPVGKVICCDDNVGVLTRYVTDQNGNLLLNGRMDQARRVAQSGNWQLIAHAS